LEYNPTDEVHEQSQGGSSLKAKEITFELKGEYDDGHSFKPFLKRGRGILFDLNSRKYLVVFQATAWKDGVACEGRAHYYRMRPDKDESGYFQFLPETFQYRCELVPWKEYTEVGEMEVPDEFVKRAAAVAEALIAKDEAFSGMNELAEQVFIKRRPDQ
jgi:hypothetical protein